MRCDPSRVRGRTSRMISETVSCRRRCNRNAASCSDTGRPECAGPAGWLPVFTTGRSFSQQAPEEGLDMRHGVLAVDRALVMAFAMLWEILWALILGFVLSAAVQAVVSKKQMSRLLPDGSPRSLAIACALGAASSSCSYAAVALARSLFRKGANFTAAMAFEFASTNLVIELGIIIVFLLGWRFAVAEFVGGLLMIIILTVLFKAFLTRPIG